MHAYALLVDSARRPGGQQKLVFSLLEGITYSVVSRAGAGRRR